MKEERERGRVEGESVEGNPVSVKIEQGERERGKVAGIYMTMYIYMYIFPSTYMINL